jgi:hypothetical protein
MDQQAEMVGFVRTAEYRYAVNDVEVHEEAS